jgi:hypothetical protein
MPALRLAANYLAYALRDWASTCLCCTSCRHAFRCLRYPMSRYVSHRHRIRPGLAVSHSRGVLNTFAVFVPAP